MLTPAWNPHLVTGLEQQYFKTRTRNITLQPELGRFYPRAMASQGLNCADNDLQPFQVVAMDDDSITADCNHPLAKYALDLSFEQRPEAPTLAKPVKPEAAAIEKGPGIQAANPYAPVDFFKPEAFKRLDENPDAVFYQQSRLVSHLDATTQAEIAKLYARFLKAGMKVLGLMSSWQSHLPDAIAELEVTGLGMNAEELQANPQLSDYRIHDLNAEPSLPFDDDSFDLVICTASIEYLIHPLKVMQEISRVLKPRCSFVTTFTERWFPPKAIALWSLLHPFERLHFAADFFHRTAEFAANTTRGA